MDRRHFLEGLSMAAAALAIPRIGAAATSSTRRLAGVFPIGFTPVTAAGQIDFDGLAAQVKFCRRGGVQGIAWPQMASGWMTLTEQDRMQGAEALISAASGGSTAIVIGVQSKTADLPETGRYAAQAEKLGADAIICIPPPGMTDPGELLHYYQQVGKTSSLPLFVQTVGDFSVDLVMEMFNSIPTFRYVKDEAGDPLKRVTEIRTRSNDQLKCFSGRGVATMITEMERGFVGHCPYVSLADLYASAYDSYHAGRVRDAFDEFGRIEAASSMFAQSDVNVLIARGVFRPGTTARTNPPPPGAAPPRRSSAESSPDAIKQELDLYLKRYLRT
ncbi:MAG: dihydrodipicolinate synthase family protein [Steroidobacteraceae bacterium]|jgi:4-hydroxy-tetrahydrodipicolinate synthase